MDNLVLRLLQYALYLGMIGGLVDATLNMRREAAHAGRNGLVSLRKLNEGLVGKPK